MDINPLTQSSNSKNVKLLRIKNGGGMWWITSFSPSRRQKLAAGIPCSDQSGASSQSHKHRWWPKIEILSTNYCVYTLRMHQPLMKETARSLATDVIIPVEPFWIQVSAPPAENDPKQQLFTSCLLLLLLSLISSWRPAQHTARHTSQLVEAHNL
jgi:hypothetical protein